jgi:two-component system, LytTR family, sensor kinase
MAFITTPWLNMKEQIRSLVWSVVLTAVAGILLYVYLHASEVGTFPSFQNSAGYAVSGVTGALTGLAIYFINRLLNRLLSWRGSFAARFIAGFFSYLVIAYLLVAGIALALISLNKSELLWRGFTINDDDLAWKLFIVLLAGAFIYAVIYSMLFSYNQYAYAQIETLQQQRKQMELQFEALKSQLSPHYLFNSLNTISSLLYKDPQIAEQFIRRLAQTYQYILATQHKPFVTLEEELEFVKSYYYLLRIRFQQLLNIEINVPNNIIGSAIPPLTLQLLVENAVKHNPVSKEKPLYIYISAIDNTQLKVVNTKSTMHDAVPSTRIGLDNIRQRYRYFTTKDIEVRDSESYTVLLPVIRNITLPRAS